MTAAYAKSDSSLEEHYFCVQPERVSKTECKNVKAFRAPSGYIDTPREGYDRHTSSVYVRFLYPSMRPLSLAEKFNLSTPPESLMKVNIYWLGQPFENSHFDHLMSIITAPRYVRQTGETLYGLRIYAQSYGEQEGGWNTQVLIPENGGKDLWMECTLPFRTVSGNINQDVSCNVWGPLNKEYAVQYSIKLKDLAQWQEIHRKTVKLIESFIVHQSR